MKFRNLLTAVGLSLFFASLSYAEDRPPNIVVIVIDDLGWNDVSYHGGPIPTPNIDRLAKEGVELDRFYVCPFCSPTRAGLMTGRYPQRFGMHGAPLQFANTKGLPPSEYTIAEMLNDAGYQRRMAIGKWHLGNSSIHFHPMRQGFSGFYGHYCGMIGYFGHTRGGQRDWHRGYEPLSEEGYSTELMTTAAVRFLRDQKDYNEPFFLYLSYNAVHTPNQATDGDLAVASNLLKQAESRFQKEGKANNWLGQSVPKNSADESKKNFKDSWNSWLSRGDNFFAMTISMDRGVGQVLSVIDEIDARENTLVWFMSDNGGTSNNYPLRGRKGRVWEGGVRVPSVIRWPNRFDGDRKVSHMITYLDVMPTLAAATNQKIKFPKSIDGLNALDSIDKGSLMPERTVYLGKQAVTRGKWKLVDNELFDLQNDPRETSNVASEHPEIVRALIIERDKFIALSGPECRPVGKEKQTAHPLWVMPHLEVDDPDVK